MDLICNHLTTENRFIGYLFTLELFATFCKCCGKQITEAKAE